MTEQNQPTPEAQLRALSTNYFLDALSINSHQSPVDIEAILHHRGYRIGSTKHGEDTIYALGFTTLSENEQGITEVVVPVIQVNMDAILRELKRVEDANKDLLGLSPAQHNECDINGVNYNKDVCATE